MQAPNCAQVYALLVSGVCVVTAYTLLAMWQDLAHGTTAAQSRTGAPPWSAWRAQAVAGPHAPSGTLSRLGDSGGLSPAAAAAASVVPQQPRVHAPAMPGPGR